MIRINRETEYSFRVVFALARAGENARLPTSRIQKEMNIPRSFLYRIIASLGHNNIIKTFPGREGGVQLARPAMEISLLDVFEAVEGPIQLSDCLSEDCSCPLDSPCPVQKSLRHVQKILNREMAAIHFDSFVPASEIRLP